MWKTVRMASDLGSEANQVHRAEIAEAADEVLRFWLVDTPADKHFAADPAFDAEIGRRFGDLHETLARDGAAGWDDDPKTLLAAVIVLDQFSRNLHRGSPKAFANDAAALALAERALDRGWDRNLGADGRQFLYMPLMHAEDAAVQERSVALFDVLGNDKAADFARRHRDQIARFGRFPGRNAALGRASTPEEERLIESGEAGF